MLNIVESKYTYTLYTKIHGGEGLYFKSLEELEEYIECHDIPKEMIRCIKKEIIYTIK